MTDREKAIVMAYTGCVMLAGDKLGVFYRYVEKKIGRKVMTHELGDKETLEEISQAAHEDFCALAAAEDEATPRVMRPYEVCKMSADFRDCMVWFEPKEVDDELWFMGYAAPVEYGDTDIEMFEFGNEVPAYAKKSGYGKTWRCWTAKPSEEQRRETAWSD